MSRGKIAVLAGGSSCEREISLISGKAVFDALVSKSFEAIQLDPDPAGRFLRRLRSEGVAKVFIALHGVFGEDGTVQRMLEEGGIPYTGSGPEASRLAFDKAAAQPFFEKKGILVPSFRIVKKNGPMPTGVPWEAPFVVKPATSGSSVGVTILRDGAGFGEALEEAFRHSDRALVESYIPGREITVGILGDAALPIVEVIPQRKFYDYQAKYADTGTRYECPARLPAEVASRVQETALKIFRLLGCRGMARVDFMLSEDGRAWALEANTIPGLTSKSLLPKAAAAAGLDFPALCVKILGLSAEKPAGFKVSIDSSTPCP